MAGNYPDVPGRAMQLDRDGSTVLGIDQSSGISSPTVTQVKNMLDENDANYYSYPASSGKLVVIFPELRDVVGAYVNLGSQQGASVNSWEKSTDTTTGLDGTWTTVTGPAADSNTPSSQRYRSGIGAIASATGIKAIRANWTRSVTGDINWRTFNLYGNIASGQNPDRLSFWHPTLDQELAGADLDFAEIARSASPTKSFRVKNRSSTLTANTIGVSTDTLNEATPATLTQLGLSSNGGSSYSSSLSIGNLAPGAISGVLMLRWAVDPVAAVGLWSPRLSALATSWS